MGGGGTKGPGCPGEPGLDADFASRVCWERPMFYESDSSTSGRRELDETLARDRTGAPITALGRLLPLAADRDIREVGVAKQSYCAILIDAGNAHDDPPRQSEDRGGSTASIFVLPGYRTTLRALRGPPVS